MAKPIKKLLNTTTQGHKYKNSNRRESSNKTKSMLKPLPQESPDARREASRPPQAGIAKKAVTPAHIKNKTRANFLRLEVTLPKVQKRKTTIFALAIAQIANFMKKAENISLDQLTELIHNLQRTVLKLQKKRIELIRRTQQKKKR